MADKEVKELLAKSASIQADLTSIITKLQEEKAPRERPVHGLSFDKYNEDVESFDDYLDRLTCFLDLQNIPDTKKVNTLVTLLSPKLYSLLKSLLYPDKFSDKTFSELTEVLKIHLNPKPLIIPSRHAFLNRKQTEGESISQYVAELRKLAIPCQYSAAMLNTMLRDVFVSGLNAKYILDRLFEENDPDFDKTVGIALALEKATLGASEILHQPHRPIHQMKPDFKRGGNTNHDNASKPTVKNKNFKVSSRPNNLGQSQGQSTQCMRCAKMGHKAPDCYSKNLFCQHCRKQGHVKEVCLGLSKNTGGQSRKLNRPSNYNAKSVKQVEIVEPSVNSTTNISIEDTLPLYQLHSSSEPPIMLKVSIDKNPLLMELDTGSAASVVSLNDFKSVCNKELQPTSIVFRSYNNSRVQPIGECQVEVGYNDQVHLLTLYVVEENFSPLFGRDWLRSFKIDWKTIKTLHFTKPNPDSSTKVHSNIGLHSLLKNFKEVFEKKVGTVKNFVCDLKLKPDAKPCFVKARPVPLALQDRVEKELEKLVEEGIIEKVDASHWATPIVPVVKPNESIRICADYSGTVNKQIEVPQHPLPRYEDVFSKLSGGQRFSTLDILSAFLHLPVSEETSHILTINTHKGLFRCKRLMYGVSAAPATWQRYIESILSDIPNICVVHDDIIVTAKTDEKHLEILNMIFDRFKTHGLHLNIDKCKFFQNEVTYLGHKINAKGISKTSDKIKAVLNFVAPTNVKEVKSFLGLVSFYGRFFPNLSTMAHPLYNLTKSSVPFVWSQKCEDSFQGIKREIVSDRVLVHYSPDLPLVLSVDASPVGLGGVLSHIMQDGSERPIAFASRTLTLSETRYSQIDKEALAIKWGVQKFFHFLYGRKFTLLTDHQPLVHIFGTRNKLPVLRATRLLHYALFLQLFQFDIKYRKSELHGNADCLSRLPSKSQDLFSMDDVSLFQLNQLDTMPMKVEDIARATQEDPELKVIHEKLRTGVPLQGKEGIMTLEENCILYGTRVYIPTKYRYAVLQELHYGHMGIVKMKALARSFVYWPNIDSDLETVARNCTACIQVQKEPKKVKTHFWEYPTQPWERIHIDFAGPFFGHTFLLIIDAHSKWPEVFVVNSTTSNATIKKLDQVFSSYGLPKVLVSDNAAVFTGFEFQQFMKANGIKHLTSAPFHAASNGQAERYVYSMKQALRSMKYDHKSVQESLNTFLFSYRRAPNVTTGESPARLFLKRDLRSKLDVFRPSLQETVAKHTKGDAFTVESTNFTERQKVAVRNYSSPNKKWLIGEIISKDGPLNYTVMVNGHLWRRHADQIRPVGAQVPLSFEPLFSGKPIGLPNSGCQLQKSPQRSKNYDSKNSVSGDPSLTQSSNSSRQVNLPSSTPNRSRLPLPTIEESTISYPNEDVVVPRQSPEVRSTRRSARPRKPPQRMNL